MKSIELQLGLFKGFYGSNISDYIDGNIDNDLREMNLDYEDCEITYDFNELAKDIFDYAKYELFDIFDFISDMEFKELYSPNFYNHSNDKIYFTCDIDKSKFKAWLLDFILKEGELKEYVESTVEDTHTSCSGFISFHSNKFEDWVKDLMELDLDNKDTVYKLGFILSEYVDALNKFEDMHFDFESEYLSNGNYCGVYSCYEIKQPENATNKRNH